MTLFYSDEKKNELQRDVLLQDLLDNPYFQSHVLVVLNKQLNTSRKNIVGAINEVLQKSNTTTLSVQNFTDQLIELLGDWLGNDSSKLEEMKANIGETILDAILQLKKEIDEAGSGNGTVTSVNGELPDVDGNVELPIATDVVEGLTTLHTIVDETDDKAVTPSAVKQYIDDLESTLIKHSFELRPTVQGQLEFDMPAIYNLNPEWYITSLHFNSIKLLESQYSIVEKVVGDPTQGYKLVLTSPAPDFTSAIYELELIGGKALASGEGGTGTVISVNGVLPDTTGNVELPTGLKLTKPEYVLTPTTIGQTEFDMPQEYQDNPDDYIYLLFFNTLKVRETEFSIQDVGGIKKLVVNNPIQSLDDRYDLVLIKGNGISSGTGSGSSVDLHQVVDDTTNKPVSPKAVKDYIERFFYEGTTPPTNTSLFWHKV